jgi:prepilin-type N-terminal cleavage/methylation domain-containing protein
MRLYSNRQGFTLIELSIVLVIIGLIVGGVLVGQDLIRAAEIRAQISQIEKYNSAVNTFRGKYGGLPGDLLYSQAGQYGLFSFSNGAAGNLGYGDGNGLIEGSSGAGGYIPGTTTTRTPNNTNAGGSEQYVFWRHLSDAHLIDGAFGAGLVNDGSNAGTSNVSLYFPPAKAGRGLFVIVFTDGAYNYFGIGPVLGILAGNLPGWQTPACCAPGYGLTPVDAHAIDVKIDDGMPNTGQVYAMRWDWGSISLGYVGIWNATPTSGNGICTTGATGQTDPAATYNVGTTTGGTTPACDMAFRFN